MIQFRCTKKVLDYLGIKNSQLCEFRDTNAILGNFYVNMFNVDRRKTILFMSDNTFFSFIMYGVRKENIEKLPNIFLGGLEQALQFEDIDSSKIDDIINQCKLIEITKTNSRSLLGNLNDLMDMYKIMINHGGGFKYCNLTEIIKKMNRTPQKNLGWKRSIDVLRKLL